MNLTCYTLDTPWKLEPAPVKRDWMNTPGNFPYRCLPLTIANAAGWIIRAPCPFVAHWNGGRAPNDVMLYFEPEHAAYAQHIDSNFGHGVITFHFPMLFRSSHATSLRVSGIPNLPKYNALGLEGIVETDWLPFTFTMNWKLVRPFIPVPFAKDEPICFLQPSSLDLIESQEPEIKPIKDDPVLMQQYLAWAASRQQHNSTNDDPNVWEKHYHTGGIVSPPTHHRTSVKLKEFA